MTYVRIINIFLVRQLFFKIKRMVCLDNVIDRCWKRLMNEYESGSLGNEIYIYCLRIIIIRNTSI